MELKMLKVTAKILRVLSIIEIILQFVLIRFVNSIFPSIKFLGFKELIIQIVLIILNTILIKKINEESEQSIFIGFLNCIVGIIVGKVFSEEIFFIIYTGALIYLILFVIGKKLGREENIWQKIIPIAFVIIMLFVNDSTINNNSKIVEDFKKIEIGDTLEELEAKMGKSGEITKNEQKEYAVFKYDNTDLTVYLENNEVYLKKITYFESEINELFGNSKISFRNFYKLKDSIDNKTLIYEELKSTLGNQEGILVNAFYGLDDLKETYIFADKNKNYLEVTLEGGTLDKISGEINGEWCSQYFF